MARPQIKNAKSGDRSPFISSLRSRGIGGNRTSSSAAIAGLALTAVAVGALVSANQKSAQSKPASVVKGITKQAPKLVITEPKVAVETPVSGRRSVEFYTGDVRASMFSEPVAPAPVEPVVPKVKPVPPEPVDPLADYSFTGSATIGTVKYAVVENINTHDSELLKAGDDFQGFKVDSVDGNFLTMTLGKTPKLLMLSMNTSYTPLSKSAAYLTNQPTQPGAPNGMDPAMLAKMGITMTPGATGMSITLPNGRTITGDQAAKYQSRLQQGWPGGGGATGATGGMGGGNGGGGGFGGGAFGGGGFGGGRRGGRGGGGGGGMRGGFGGG